ncbi:hypothetical protein C1645_803064 [Glomus cerebriforme]|uniref:Uncharacterized protein n=1 Tax=Glomus cerebriforme TaxID=658196 RepID=A0A397TAS4_9GLOM|nr:hypothetical protein C1645_803064 [Glomus cerebriforme]
MDDRKNSICLDDSDDEQFHSRFASEKYIISSSSMVTYNEVKQENEKFDNLSPNKRKRLTYNSMSKEINNSSLKLNDHSIASEKFVPQDFVLNNNFFLCDDSILFEDNSFMDDVEFPLNGYISKTEKIDTLEDDFVDIPSYIPSLSIKLKEIVIGNYNNLNPGLLSLNSSANSICIELQANNNLDRIDFHVKGIQYNNVKHNVIQLNLVHDWIKYFFPVREVSSLEEIKIKIDPTGGELRRAGCIKLFLENNVNTRDVNCFEKKFRKMKYVSKPPISPILKWKETKLFGTSTVILGKSNLIPNIISYLICSVSYSVRSAE